LKPEASKFHENHPKSRRRGSILPLFALGITVLLGATALVIDYRYCLRSATIYSVPATLPRWQGLDI
jgi:hypothetical protein